MNARSDILAPPPHTLISQTPAELIDIFAADTQLAVWERPIDPAIATYLDASRQRLGSGLRISLSPGALPDLSGLPDGPGRSALADDIRQLTELLGELLDCPRIGMRLEVIGKAMCPRLHVDRVGIRLLCTYRGPGTEWISDSGADQRKLGAGAGGQPDEVSGLFGPETRIESVAPFAVSLLKGSLWQGNTGRGIIHRSPDVPTKQLPRVVLALDGMW